MKKILILAANPKGTSPLGLDEEVRDIDDGLQRAKHRDQFDLVQRWAVRPRDIRRAMLDINPQIVHFSGHGTGEEGLVLEDETGQAKLVSGEALTALFKLFADQLECVVLNSCYAQKQAEEIVKYIPYVIGMKQAIGDKAAIEFAVGFYDALGAGRSVEFAYKLGCSAIQMAGISEHLTPVLKKRTDLVSDSVGINSVDINLESIDGQVPLNSSFYIERSSKESNCYETILESGALIRIKAPCKMGKTSLMSRILNHASQKDYQTVFVNLWSPELLTDIKTFLQWFCATVSEALNLEVKLEQYWKKFLSSQQNCSKYFHDYILKETASPIVLGLDDIDQIFPYSQIAQEFFKLLRSWHEKGKNDPQWQKLRIVIAHSQEIYAHPQLDINSSPFNVGFDVELGEFNKAQVQELIQRHQLKWSQNEIDRLINMIGRHPYLLRVALYHIAKGDETLEHFLQLAPTNQGLYNDHLYKYLLALEENNDLKVAMKQVIESNQPVKLESKISFKLRSLGIVKDSKNEIIPLCNLYRLYFAECL